MIWLFIIVGVVIILLSTSGGNVVTPSVLGTSSPVSPKVILPTPSYLVSPPVVSPVTLPTQGSTPVTKLPVSTSTLTVKVPGIAVPIVAPDTTPEEQKYILEFLSHL